MNRRAFLLGTTGTAVTLAGCNQGGGSGSETTETPAETAGSMSRPALVSHPEAVVGCDEQIHPASGGSPLDASDIVVGPLGFPAILHYAPTWEFESESDTEHIKARVVLKRGTVVTLVIPETEREHVALAYSSTAVHSVRFEACDAQRTQWAGDIIVTGSRCVTLQVWVETEKRPRTVVIPFGTENCN